MEGDFVVILGGSLVNLPLLKVIFTLIKMLTSFNLLMNTITHWLAVKQHPLEDINDYSGGGLNDPSGPKNPIQ